tara:strand:- start:540 stop:1406 length:867 start_codon:yes stop_codon:yes gene_type:complete
MVQNYRKKILIIGANGQLGSTLEKYLTKYYEVYATSYMSKDPLDVTNRKKLDAVISTIKPNYVINCAAFTNVDKNETDRKYAYSVNVGGIKNIISATNKDIKIIHISTDYIFDGLKESYKENDIPNPLNYYGKLKLESENILKSSNRSFLIIRPSVIYNDSHQNFYTWVYQSLIKNKKIKVVTDQISNPTWSWSLSEVIYKSILNNLDGVFHYGGGDVISRYEFALKISDIFSFNSSNIVPVETSEINQLANRPARSTLNSDKINKILKINHPDMDYIINLFKDRISE